MKDYIKFVDGLPWIVRLILQLFFVGVIMHIIYRIAKGSILFAILSIPFCWLFWWIDFFSLLLNKKLVWLI